jgi:hypothetical protein
MRDFVDIVAHSSMDALGIAGEKRASLIRALNPVHGEFVITLRLASGTDRGSGAAKRSDQGQRGLAVVRQIVLLECCH